MSAFFNLVQFSTPTTGTGPLTVGAALPAKRTPAQSAIADGAEISYSIIDGLNYEYGRGIVGGSGTTMTRVPLGSSSAGAAIALSGAAKVAFVLLAEDINNLLPAPKKQRPITASTPTTIVVDPTDMILNCNISASATCTLPLASSRAGQPVTFKDWGQAATHPITFTPTSPDLIDGQSSFVLGNNYAGVTFVPANDGANHGWSVE